MGTKFRATNSLTWSPGGPLSDTVYGARTWIVVPLEDEPMVVAVPLHPLPHHLPELHRPQILTVELRDACAVRGTVEDFAYHPEDIRWVSGVRSPNHLSGSICVALKSS